MSTVLIVLILLLIALHPNEPRPRVNKKKLHEERIKIAHRLMQGQPVPHLQGKPITYESAKLTGGVPYKEKEHNNG